MEVVGYPLSGRRMSDVFNDCCTTPWVVMFSMIGVGTVVTNLVMILAYLYGHPNSL